MAWASELARLSNPLVSSHQLIAFQREQTANSSSILFATLILTQSAGVLCRVPQEVIATALVLFQRHWISSHASNITQRSPKTASATCLYLAAKGSFFPLSPRSIVNVYAYLTSSASPLRFINPSSTALNDHMDPHVYFVSEGTYERERQKIFKYEISILTTIAFEAHVALPYTLALTYIQVLGVLNTKLSRRVFEHLNGGLLSPQLLYLTHQPNALAAAAIYLAAREIGQKLVEEDWWEIFDVEREDLGFLVLAFGSLSAFAEAERNRWCENVISLSEQPLE